MLPSRFESPKLTLAGISLIEVGLFEQRFNLRLRVQNPNERELPLQALIYEVEINDRPFGSGVARKPVTIPGFGSAVVEVEMVSNLASVLRQLGELDKNGASRLRYRLRGNAVIGPHGSRVPFQQTGEVGIPRFNEEAGSPLY